MKCNTGLSWFKDLKVSKDKKLVNGKDLFLVGRISQALAFLSRLFFLPSLILQGARWYSSKNLKNFEKATALFKIS